MTKKDNAMNDRYAVIAIGCLECGHTSDLIGVMSRDEALEAGAKIRDEMSKYEFSGDVMTVAFRLPDLNAR